MACRALQITSSDESFHSDELSEIDFMYSTKESENKDTGYIFCNGKSSTNGRGVSWTKCFSSLWMQFDCTGAENIEYICDFFRMKQTCFSHNL